jgi:hypothetical protein
LPRDAMRVRVERMDAPRGKVDLVPAAAAPED